MKSLMKHDILSNKAPSIIPFDNESCRKISKLSGMSIEEVKDAILSGKSISTYTKRYHGL